MHISYKRGFKSCVWLDSTRTSLQSENIHINQFLIIQVIDPSAQVDQERRKVYQIIIQSLQFIFQPLSRGSQQNQCSNNIVAIAQSYRPTNCKISLSPPNHRNYIYLRLMNPRRKNSDVNRSAGHGYKQQEVQNIKETKVHLGGIKPARQHKQHVPQTVKPSDYKR